MTKKLTNEIIDNRLKDRNIKRIGEYVNTRTKIEFQCLKFNCLNIWISRPNNIISGSNCPKCSDNKITNEIIDEKLKNRNIKRIGNYISAHTKIEFQCLKFDCLNIWKTEPNSIINKETGCFKCGGNEKLTNEIIDNRLKDRNIKIIGKYINNKTKTEFQCLNNYCLNIWKSTPGNVINKKVDVRNVRI